MTCVGTLQCYCGALIVQAHGREVFYDHDNADCDTLNGKGFPGNGGGDETPEFHIIWSPQFCISTKLGEVSQYPEKALTSGPGGGPYWVKIR